MVKEENRVKRLILKAFQAVVDFLLHIEGFRGTQGKHKDFTKPPLF